MKWLLNNFWLKIAALILSVSCWFYVKEVLNREQHRLNKENVSSEILISKKVAVQLVLEGIPQEGFKVIKEKIAIKPESIFIVGPKEAIEDTAFIRTFPISISGFSKTFTKKVELVSFKEGISLKNGFVEVTIPIEKSP
ncbi:MAG: YbbR-like domain-containing protein [Candidatus Omnitrophica bacterium]|nr:YbbR-like domain-containing protein [Candidatus Omnitrophota bacterium]